VLAPVVLVGSLEALKSLFDGGRDGLLVMEQTTKEDKQVRQQPRHSVGKGSDKGAKAKDSPMSCRHQNPGRALAALWGRAA